MHEDECFLHKKRQGEKNFPAQLCWLADIKTYYFFNSSNNLLLFIITPVYHEHAIISGCNYKSAMSEIWNRALNKRQ